VPCGQWSDLKLAKDAFVHCLQPGEKAVADGGCRDDRYLTKKVTMNETKEFWQDTKL